jgi:hypothetical protein
MKRSRKRTLPLFDQPTVEQETAVRNDPDELIRLAFPELSRCHVCDVLDRHTKRWDFQGEKVWLHEDCSINFKPLECYPVMYLGSGVYQVDDPNQEIDDDDGDGDDDGDDGNHRRPRKKRERRLVGAVVLIDKMWLGFWYNKSNKLKIELESENREDVVNAFRSDLRMQPSDGLITRLIKRGRPQLVKSVRWCGGLQKCSCYDDGEITAHKFRWEYEEIVMRRVKKL